MAIEDLYLGILALCVYMAPLAIIAGSKLTRDNEKTGWLLATILLSWIALVCYYSTVLSPAERKRRHKEQMKRQHQADVAAARQQLQQQLQQQREQALEAALSTEAAPEMADEQIQPENISPQNIPPKQTNAAQDNDGDRGKV